MKVLKRTERKQDLLGGDRDRKAGGGRKAGVTGVAPRIGDRCDKARAGWLPASLLGRGARDGLRQAASDAEC